MKRIGDGDREILIGRGLVDRLGALLPDGRAFLVSDAGVSASGWTDKAEQALAGVLAGSFQIASGEPNKNLGTLEKLVDALLEAGIERSDKIVALGGGLVGDVAGFAAAIVKRGCGFVTVPTTLLAQVDSAIGGKTGINTRHGKNLVGAFHLPERVVIDIDTLATLPRRDLVAGYAELVKYGLIADAELFAWCEVEGAALLDGDEARRLEAVEAAVRAKMAAIAGDLRDRTGERARLNFGHSFAHALEAEGMSHHGEAVAVGMAMAFRFAVEHGLAPSQDLVRVEAHLASVGLPIRPSDLGAFDPVRLLARMRHDKKNQNGRFRLVLPHRIGSVRLLDVDTDAALSDFLARETAPAIRVSA